MRYPRQNRNDRYSGREPRNERRDEESYFDRSEHRDWLDQTLRTSETNQRGFERYREPSYRNYSHARENLGREDGPYSQSRAESSEQSFAGRGPKGYRRSDERIREDVCEMLTRDPSIDASDIEVAVKEGEVTLTGNVSDRRMKHLAEDCAERCSGVRDVTNNIRVRREASSSSSASEDSSQSLTGDRTVGKRSTSTTNYSSSH